MRKLAAMALAALLIVGAGQAQADRRLDGNWWVAQDDSGKTGYLMGLADGVDLGHAFTVGPDGAPGAAYTAAYNRYIAGVSNRELLAGLDEFYGDRANRQVKFADALMAVLKKLAGDADADAFAARIKAAPAP